MLKKEIFTSLAIILIIFSVGFMLRAESTNLSGIPDNAKAYYQDQNGLPYMYELDSYYNYRLTKNYIEHGHPGDIKINGTTWDLHSYYPPGRSAEYSPFIIELTALVYKIVNLFANVPLLTVCFWLPAFIAPLSGIVAYLFVRRFTNEYGAFIAGILTVTAPFYFIRTVPGWFDTDMFNIIFPLLITWFIIEAIYNKKKLQKICFAILAAFITSIFSTAWEGWIYTFYLIVLSLIIYIGILKLRKYKIKEISYVLCIFLFSTIIFVSLLTNVLNLENLTLPFQIISSNINNSWPEVYTTVLELQKPSIERIIMSIGPILLFFGILGFALIFRITINEKMKKTFLGNLDWFFYIFMVLWVLTGLFLMLNGIRFIIMILPPLIISSGIFTGTLIEYLNILKIKKHLTNILSLSLVIIIVIAGTLNAYDSSSINPVVNDDMWDASEWIHNNTPNNTVIISKWSYGYFFEVVADRPTSVDGGSQNTPKEYWINRALSTSDEKLSLGIFRMLSTSGDKTWITLDNYTKNTSQSIEILNNILGLDKTAANNVLINNYHFNQTQAYDILEYTHPKNPKPFIIVTYNGIVNIGKWIFSFGEWDFNKKREYDYTYSIGMINKDKNNILKTDDGIFMDLKTGNITWNNKTPYSVIIVEKNKVDKQYMDKNSNISVILLMDDALSVVIDKRFENSLFTKLILERKNTTYFKTIYDKNVLIWAPK